MFHLSPYSGTEDLVKYLFSAAQRTNRINQIRDGSNKDNEILADHTKNVLEKEEKGNT